MSNKQPHTAESLFYGAIINLNQMKPELEASQSSKHMKENSSLAVFRWMPYNPPAAAILGPKRKESYNSCTSKRPCISRVVICRLSRHPQSHVAWKRSRLPVRENALLGGSSGVKVTFITVRKAKTALLWLAGVFCKHSASISRTSTCADVSMLALFVPSPCWHQIEKNSIAALLL